MGWEIKNEYAQTLIDTVLNTPTRVVSVPWPERLASFILEVTPIGANDSTRPNDDTSLLREARYNIYLQGVHDGTIFWEPYGASIKTRYTISEEIGEVVGGIYEDLDNDVTTVAPRLRVICPTDHRVVLVSTRLGYKP